MLFSVATQRLLYRRAISTTPYREIVQRELRSLAPFGSVLFLTIFMFPKSLARQTTQVADGRSD